MARIRYPEVMRAHFILMLLRRGIYRVDTDTGLVYGQKGELITLVPSGPEGYLFVRLYWASKRKAIAVHRLVWMARTGRPIPPGFEVHHRDTDTQRNAFSNLLCLHELDHRKLHQEEGPAPWE
jgi:hypothetical protein